MSHNQSRGERTESSQYRKSGRSNQHRNFSGGGSKGSGSGAGATAPSPSSNNNPPLSSNRSFKKHSNVQGGPSRVSNQSAPALTPDPNTHLAQRALQNGAHPQQQSSHGLSDAPVSSTNVKPAAIKPADMATPKATRAPRAPSSNVPTPGSDSKPPPTPATTAKAPVEASRSFPLQFGSINPGLMNGMQVPARTSSAPPNLDEQKRDQARHESFKAPSNIPPPSIPKQQLPRKDAGMVDQTNNTSEVHAAVKPKREVPISAAPPVTQTLKPSVHPIHGLPMQMQFPQQQMPVQFGGHSPQIQSQAMSATTLQMPMPMPLTMGNQPVQQPMFVSGIQHHAMQSQGIIHQGQALNFTSQMGPQLAPQLSNMPMNMGPQYPQQQAGKFGGPRKAVKITHPDTHEELRLDGSPAPRSHPNVIPQSQPISSFPPAHGINYYPNPNSYNSSSLFFSTPSSLPPTSQPTRLYNQVTVKPAASSHVEKDHASSVGSPWGVKAESQKLSRPSPKDSETSSQTLKPGPSSTSTSVSSANKAAVALGSDTSLRPAPISSSPAIVVPPKDSSAGTSSGDGLRQKTVGVLDPAKGERKNLGCNADPLPLDKVVEEPTTGSELLLQEPVAVGDQKIASSVTSAVPVQKESVSVAVVPEPGTLDTTSESSKSFVNIVVENYQSEHEASVKQEQVSLPDDFRQDNKSIERSLESSSSLNPSGQEEGKCLEAEQIKIDESGLSIDHDVGVDHSVASSTSVLDDGEMPVSAMGKVDENVVASVSDGSLNRPDNSDIKETVIESTVPEKESMPVPVPSSHSEENFRCDEDVSGPNCTSSVFVSAITKEKSVPESNVAKTTVYKGKKKKNLYKKLDNIAPTADLYTAYKGPEEKKEMVVLGEAVSENDSTNNVELVSSHTTFKEVSEEKPSQIKVEPEDWEDAADISTPKLETSEDGSQVIDSGEDVNGTMTKKYSRDFLLKFADQFPDLPVGFLFPPDVLEAMMVSNANVSRESYHTSGRIIERQNSSSRLDRRGNGMMEEDKWTKMPGPHMTARDMRMSIGYGTNVVGFQPGQVINYGVLRNPRMQAPMQYPIGILGGPLPSPGSQMMPRNSPDSDRWQRGTAFQKGLMPSPQTPLQMMHKADRKYEIGKVTDEEQAKQRQLKAILNKLTPQNFEKLFEQVKQVNIDNAVTLSGVISQIFDKALMEPTFCEMYANFCHHLAAELPDLSVDNEKITFKRLLLNKCQEEFERGEREEEEANKVEEEGEVKQTAEEREEKRLKARRRMLGNIRLIGELYKKKMLTERIMHECIKKLLGQYQNPDEENVEALCKLMSTIGEMIDHPKAKEHMDAYFDVMAILSNNMKLSSRVRFMLKDVIDLRKNKWQQRRKVEGPKKIDEVHRDAAQERQAQATRLARTPSMGTSVRRAQPMDFSPRGSNILASPNSQMGGFRAVPPQLRGFGSQDARMDERHVLDNRGLSVPLPQRPLGDDSITLGPQGGLARGMSFRGQPASPGIPLDIPSPVDSRRLGSGLNGYNPASDRTLYTAREELLPRQMSERYASTNMYDQSGTQERNMNYGSRDSRPQDRGSDRSHPSLHPRGGVQTIVSTVPSEKEWSEDRLRDRSMAAIKEFYSAKDENEVALCIKELNNPSFYPSMISLWVTDSFERKDLERDLLAELLINLTKSHDSMMSQDQLIRGFESVLMTLEDAVNDAPKAAEFLGRIFAKIILENIIPLHEVGRLMYEGGEEQGRLIKIGLAAEVLGTILEIITSEGGNSALTEIRSSSKLRLENFRPPGSSKSWRLDKFI